MKAKNCYITWWCLLALCCTGISIVKALFSPALVDLSTHQIASSFGEKIKAMYMKWQLFWPLKHSQKLAILHYPSHWPKRWWCMQWHLVLIFINNWRGYPSEFDACTFVWKFTPHCRKGSLVLTHIIKPASGLDCFLLHCVSFTMYKDLYLQKPFMQAQSY